MNVVAPEPVHAASRRAALKGGLALTVAAIGIGAPLARAIDMADLLLVLSADISRSVDAQKFKLQREGYAAAISDPQVVRLMRAGPHKKIAMCFVEWSGDKNVTLVVEWQSISSQADANEFAGKVVAAPRLFLDRTSISSGIDFSMTQLGRCPYGADRRVIDISGDGQQNEGRYPSDARDETVARGITINGLPILAVEGGLDRHYQNFVIGGTGAFMIAAATFGDFADAIRRKLIREIS